MPQKIFDIFPPPKIKREQKVTEKAPKSLPKQKKVLRPKTFFKKSLIFVFGFLVAAGAFYQIFLSEIEIEIWPKTEILNFSQKITIDSHIKEPDFLKRIIPGQVLEQETGDSQQFSSTGIKEKGERARGIIRVYNNYHIPQTLVTNTGFLSDEKLFRSQNRIYIPVDSYTEVEVRAVNPGPEYNIKPSTFSIPGLVGYPQYTAVYGKSLSTMEGGFVGEIARVSKDDLDQAKEILVQRLKNEAREYFKNKLGAGFILLEDATEHKVVDFSSVELGTEAENFTVQAKTMTKTLAFKEQDLNNFVKEFIKAKISQDKKLQESSLEIDYSLESVNLQSDKAESEGKAVLSLEFSARVYSDITDIAAKENLINKSLKEIRILFENHPGVEKFQIKSWPFWMKKVPKNMNKIKIELNLNNSTGSL